MRASKCIPRHSAQRSQRPLQALIRLWRLTLIPCNSQHLRQNKGIWGKYRALAVEQYAQKPYNEVHGPVDIQDMVSETTCNCQSHFMQLLNQPWMQKPQEVHGTFWALMAASILPGGGQSNASAYASSQAESDKRNLPYPDGDGVIQADDALAMPADFKVLYGAGMRCNGPSVPSPCQTAGFFRVFGNGEPQYSHEANSCDVFLLGATFCLTPPYYLNDGCDGFNPPCSRLTQRSPEDRRDSTRVPAAPYGPDAVPVC